MLRFPELTLVTLLLALQASASLYTSSSAVLQLDANNFDKEIVRSNHAAVVEFYAPWCGHCKSLAPAYEKAAKSLKGLAKVAAVNCDDEKNKAFCGSQGIQGFPTLKIFKPTQKKGKPIVEDYKGGRTAKAIVDAVVDKIPNHVDRVTSKELSKFLTEANNTAKAILFTTKGTTSALYKALAIDFLGSIKFAQIRDKEKEAADVFGVKEYPKLIVLPGGDSPGSVYKGEMKKEPLYEFLKAIAPPAKHSEDSGHKQPKKEKKTKKESATEDPTGSAEASPPPPKETPNTIRAIPELADEAALADSCFAHHSRTCILAVVLTSKEDPINDSKLAGINEASQARKGMKFYKVPALSDHGKALIEKLELSKELPAVVAVNGSKRWYKKFKGDATHAKALIDWLDAIKLGEGKKEKLPASYLQSTQEPEPERRTEKPVTTPVSEPEPERQTEKPATTSVAEPGESVAEAASESKTATEHDEL